jgi:hypothetical protein
MDGLKLIEFMRGDIKKELQPIQKRLEAIKLRQNKIIESLAIRSLEQETDIRELKRLT